MKAYQLGWDSKGGRSGTLKRKRINTKVLRGMHSSPTEKKKTTLGELSEAAVCSKNNGACSFAQVSFFFFSSYFLFFSSFPRLITEEMVSLYATAKMLKYGKCKKAKKIKD